MFRCGVCNVLSKNGVKPYIHHRIWYREWINERGKVCKRIAKESHTPLCVGPDSCSARLKAGVPFEHLIKVELGEETLPTNFEPKVVEVGHDVKLVKAAKKSPSHKKDKRKK